MKEEIFLILPINIRSLIQKINPTILNKIEEIRIRENRPLEIVYENKHAFISKNGELIFNPEQAYYPNSEDTSKILNLISNHSIYRFEEELKRGYITVKGGHRVGIAGKVILEKGEVKTITNITSFNIRIAKQIIGVADFVIPYIFSSESKGVLNTLIISPPQCGKTTLLRDISRQISGHMGYKVGIIDERSEIAGCVNGVPQNNIGYRTDVLDGCPKAEGMMMMIRSMSPDVIIVDEIGRQEDTYAILEARNAGVNVIATAHGRSIKEIIKRPTISTLIQQEIFSRYFILNRKNEKRYIEKIMDEKLNQLLSKERYYA